MKRQAGMKQIRRISEVAEELGESEAEWLRWS